MSNIDKTKEQLVAELASISRMNKHDAGLFEILLNCLPMPYILVDTNERVVQTNQACLDMLEIDSFEESCYGRTLAEVFYNDPQHETVVGHSIRKDKTFKDIEVITRDHKGNNRHIVANVFPLYDFENICIGGMCIYVDTTVRKLAEKELYNSNRALKAFKVERESPCQVSRTKLLISMEFVRYWSKHVDTLWPGSVFPNRMKRKQSGPWGFTGMTTGIFNP